MVNTTQFDSEKSFAPNRSTFMVEKISQEIHAGKLHSGQRLASIRDLAKDYKVSFGVARAAIEKLAGMGLVQKSRGSGTYVTYSQEQEKPCSMSGVYLMLNSKAHLYDHLAADLASYLHEDGLQAIKVTWNRDAGIEQFSKMFDWWKQEPPQAIVTQWEYPDLDKAIMDFCGEKTRVIGTFRLSSRLPDGWSSVVADRGDAVKIAIRHFLLLGHKRLGLVMNEIGRYDGTKRESAMNARLNYRRMTHSASEALRLHASDANLCVHQIKIPVDGGDCDPFSESSLSRIKKWLSNEDRPTAIVGQDSYLVAVKRVAEEIGLRIPEDIVLIGLGNTPWAEAGDLTSVWMREDIIARRIWELIAADEDMFFGTSRHLLVKPEIVYRSSCRA